MRNLPKVKEWLTRAKSNLEIARMGRVSPDIFYEDLCFECQQSVEKALKGLLIFYNVDFPLTHIIANLLELIEDQGIEIPEEIRDSIDLTIYAVMTRYPSFRKEPVSEEEYKNALDIAGKVCDWVKETLNME